MKKYSVILLSYFLLLFVGCSKDNTEAPKETNVLDPDFTLKYEIKFSCPTLSSPASLNYIYYWTEDLNQNKQIEVRESIPSGTTTWTKIINTKLKNRPYKMGLRSETLTRLSCFGDAICTIYVNNKPYVSNTTSKANADRSIDIGLFIMGF